MADSLTADVAEIKAIMTRLERKVDGINNSVRDNSEAVAVLLQWRHDHEKANERTENRISALSNRIWAIGGVDGFMGFLGTILHWFMP